jgi:hypothetical protein
MTRTWQKGKDGCRLEMLMKADNLVRVGRTDRRVEHMRGEDTGQGQFVMVMGTRWYGRCIYFIYLWMLSKESDIYDLQER